jgi:hypothetical protein
MTDKKCNMCGNKNGCFIHEANRCKLCGCNVDIDQEKHPCFIHDHFEPYISQKIKHDLSITLCKDEHCLKLRKAGVGGWWCPSHKLCEYCAGIRS